MDWLERYGGDYHNWRSAYQEGHYVYYRPVGVVESSFDTDGVYYEGRADVSMAASFQIKSRLSKDQLRRKLVMAWTMLRSSHALLNASAQDPDGFMNEETTRKSGRFCLIRIPNGTEEAIRWAEDQLVHMDDCFKEIDLDVLYSHSQNASRILNPKASLSKLLVLPLVKTATDEYILRFAFILAHQITDGLTNNVWIQHFMQLLNTPVKKLESDLAASLATFHTRLPLPQESLYPPISESRARQRWFWAITIILRHVHKLAPKNFANPLSHRIPRTASLPSEHTFAQAFPYIHPPKINAGTVAVHISAPATTRLHRLCRQVSCSLGAGNFVLIAIVMMELYQTRFPDISASDRLPFRGSFPINPRPFFDHHAPPDGMMLAFSEGVTLPFLPSHLDLDARIRLLLRSTQRQLGRYQKRDRGHAPGGGAEGDRAAKLRFWGVDGPGRIIALNHLDVVDRVRGKGPGRSREAGMPPPGLAYPKPQGTGATCGISSVGRVADGLRPGRYDVARDVGEGEDAFVADIREVRQGVRPRDGEFLVGISGTEDRIEARVSYDACSIDPVWAERWKEKMETILEVGEKSKL